MNVSQAFEIFGVNQRSTKEEVGKRYRELAFEMHPDRGGDEEKFKDLSQAYSVV